MEKFLWHSAVFAISFSCLPNAYSVELVESSCKWKPASEKLLKTLLEPREAPLCTQSRPDDCDQLLVEKKGRTFLYSLPHEDCKSDIFLVYRDAVTAVGYYPDETGAYSDGNFVRVVYSSKKFKKDISGWIQLEKLCRLNANGHCPTNNLTPK
jgi:hypothetical protein